MHIRHLIVAGVMLITPPAWAQFSSGAIPGAMNPQQLQEQQYQLERQQRRQQLEMEQMQQQMQSLRDQQQMQEIQRSYERALSGPGPSSGIDWTFSR